MRPMAEQVSVTTEIAAPVEQVWAMVSDLTRMGEWSPENEGATWLKARRARNSRRSSRRQPQRQEEMDDARNN